MTDHVTVGSLEVAADLARFIDGELLPAAHLDRERFWLGFEKLIGEVMPANRALLAERDRLQTLISQWHRDHRGQLHDHDEYLQFLTEIGYLLPEPEPFELSTTGIDAEVGEIAGPQLVVPVQNARFAVNAVNARWGSLYDAFYGTDAIGDTADTEPTGGYNPIRGARVVAAARDFLDQIAPLNQGSHAAVTDYRIDGPRLIATLDDETTAELDDPTLLQGFLGDPAQPSSVLLRHHGLGVEIEFDRASPIGSTDAAGVSDVLIESAVTTIVDFEDSVSAVDARDKVAAYRNWLGLNRGDLSAVVSKGDATFTRTMADDLEFSGLDGGVIVLPRRSLMFVRTVGHLMTTDAVLDGDGHEIGEGLLDTVVAVAGAIPGLDAGNPRRNGRAGSIYVVKPKMHGPDEVAFTVELLSGVEDLLGLPRNTVKLGVMDEERRLSANLLASIEPARQRLAFINTGFLDRSGDEIHTSFEAGPLARKSELRERVWMGAYEDQNVDIGLLCGLAGRAQIGKGMWAMPNQMAAMLAQKVAHPQAGATTAWVPSPTAATLHALHYHQVDVWQRHRELGGARRASRSDLLRIPLGKPSEWTADERLEELDGNVQSILGYVVRWIDQGIGCSTVPDIHGVGLMEDRATLRISSQLLANWLHHGVVTADELEASLRRMAEVVDAQNADDPAYRPMAEDPDASIAFATARELIVDGATQPNGYTDVILHARRRERKAADSPA